jgi:4a-hydroxytetrahydrobiopterin dehydratase
MKNLVAKKCVPCKGGVVPFGLEKIEEMLLQVKGWEVFDNKKIQKSFKFKTFREAIDFVNKVADVAEQEGHHPDIHIHYNKVKLVLWTHAIGGLSENDFIMAAKIDLILGWKQELETFLAAKLSKFLTIKILTTLVIILLFVILYQWYAQS